MRKLLEQYPVVFVVILTLLIGVITIGSVAIPRIISDNNLPTTNVNF